MRALFFDVETCSALNLTEIGAWLYARHPTTDLRCASYCLVADGVRGPIETWWPGEPVPQPVLDVAPDFNAGAIAFNNAFDRQIWDQILTPRYSWPTIPLKRHWCAQAAVLAHALPGSLDGAAVALKLKTRKTAEGAAAMKRLAGPRKQSKKERKAGVPLDFTTTPEELETLGDYNRRDVLMTMEIVDRVGLLSDAEQALWQLDQQINERGVGIDVNLLESALLLAQQAAEENQERIAELTGGTVTTPKQRDRILHWLKERGCALPNLAKGTVADALLEPRFNAPARALLELRRDGAGGAAGKLKTLRRWTPDIGEPRIRFAYRFHGASSGRFTSMGVQLHNLRKPELADVRSAIEAVAGGSLAEMRARGFEQPLETVGHVTRAIVVAPPRRRLFVADLSGIEARGAAYLVGASAELEQWRTFDRTGQLEDDPYYRTGIATFAQAPEKARKAGKTGALAFQYQGGVGAYRRITGDTETADEAIAARRDAWRNAHPDYVRFWRTAVFQAVQAIRNPGQEFTAKGVPFQYNAKTGFLEVALPSGRRLTYPQAEIIEDHKYDSVSFTFLDASGSRTGRMYHERRGSGVFGGLLLENVTQALCRDVFIEAMPRLEAAGYAITMHTHDEFVCEVAEDFGSLEEFLKIITTPPSWAPGFPIAAKARISDRLIEIAEPAEAGSAAADHAIDNAAAEAQEDAGDGEDETADLEPAPEASPGPWQKSAQVCLHCHHGQPDGLERVDAHNGGWLHPGCVDAFLQARMAEEGTPWDSPTRPARAPPPPSPAGGPKSNGAPCEPCQAPPSQPSPPTSNGRGDGGYPHGEDTSSSAGPTVQTYFYRNAAGRMYMRVDRKVHEQADENGKRKKSFPTAYWHAGEWVWGWPREVVPYRLPELLAAPPTEPVCICEGEKDADNVAALGLVATTNPGGAKVWQPELAQWFKGKQLAYVLEDNDDAGREHTCKILAALTGVVPNLAVVQFPELPETGDVSDWIEASGNKKLLLARAAQALKHGKELRSYVATNLATVKPRAVHWIWPGHLARGGLELLAGTPEIGKSQIHCQYIACATTGRDWPNGMPGIVPCRVIVLTAEDTIEDTLVPRLKAAGADLKLIEELKAVRRNNHDEMFLLGEDLGTLEQMIRDFGDIGLVTIDPITAYLGHAKHFDSHRASDVRSQLSPLKRLAERTGVAFSAITHPPKNASARALDHFIGSQAFIAAARVGHLCVAEMEEGENGAKRETGRRFFTNPKINIDRRQATLVYRVKVVDLDDLDADSGEPIRAPLVCWEGESEITAEEALAVSKPTKGGKGPSAKDFLADVLIGGPVLQKMVIERGAERGFSLQQLKRAKTTLAVETFKKKGLWDGPWYWAFSEHVPPDVEKDK